jgi:hypothetical protein
VIVGLILFAISLVFLAYTYFSYKFFSKSLMGQKEEDLVSYYLQLGYKLFPAPFWSALIGIVIMVVSIIFFLFSLPGILLK